MFFFGRRRRKIGFLLKELHGKNERAQEAIQHKECSQAFDHYTSVVRRYAEARKLMGEARPSRDLVTDFENATTAVNELRNQMMGKCLR